MIDILFPGYKPIENIFCPTKNAHCELESQIMKTKSNYLNNGFLFSFAGFRIVGAYHTTSYV